MNCPKCNAVLDDNSRFCNFCGAQIVAANPIPQQQPTVPQEAPVQPTAPITYVPQETPVQPTAPVSYAPQEVPVEPTAPVSYAPQEVPVEPTAPVAHVPQEAPVQPTTPVTYVPQEDYAQPAYTPGLDQTVAQAAYSAEQVILQPTVDKPKKKKGWLIAIIIVAAVLLLAGVGFAVQQLFQVIGLGSSIKGNDVFEGERYDEMVWGYYEEENYSYDKGGPEDTATFRQDMKFENTFLEEDREVELSVLPVDIEFGNNSHFMSAFPYQNEYYHTYTEKGRAMFRKVYAEEKGDITEEEFQKFEKIFSLKVANLTMCNPEGSTYSGSFVYKVVKNKIEFYLAEIDDNYNITQDDKPTFVYEFLHDGGKLILKNKGVTRNFLAHGYKDQDPLSFAGYALNEKEQYKDLVGLDFYQDEKTKEIDVRPRLTSGYRPVDPVMTLDKTTGAFTLNWEKCETDVYYDEVSAPMSISGTMIPCTSYGFTNYEGFIMIVDGKQYRYLMSEDEYDERLEDLAGGNELSDAKSYVVEQKKQSILTELETAFKNEGIDAKVDSASGKIALETSFLFDTDSYQLSAEGQTYLDKFMKAYTSVLLKEENASYVSKIVVEGHTDTDGTYSYNLKLSQNRADSVVKRCAITYPQIANSIQAVGCSYDYPVYNDDGTVNMEASRRVTFSFVLQE